MALGAIDNALNTQAGSLSISQDKVVRLRFRVCEAPEGRVLQFGDDLVYLHGGYGGAFPAVELALEGRGVGENVRVELTPEEGYGIHHSERVICLPRDAFDAHPEMGETVDGCLPDGRSMPFTVTAIGEGEVTLDGNHPFAGKHLQFDFEVLEIRDSSEAERQAGFAFDGLFG